MPARTRSPIDFDCQSCGACCAYDSEWPTVRETDTTPGDWVVEGAMRFENGRCTALDGDLGGCVSCRIYIVRPQTCRDCEPGSVPCLIARRHHGLPVPEEPSTMEFL